MSYSSTYATPACPSDNNPAERALRPWVIMRKISGGSRSHEGSKTRLTLFSLVSTWAARGLNPFSHCCLTLLQPIATDSLACHYRRNP